MTNTELLAQACADGDLDAALEALKGLGYPDAKTWYGVADAISSEAQRLVYTAELYDMRQLLAAKYSLEYMRLTVAYDIQNAVMQMQSRATSINN